MSQSTIKWLITELIKKYFFVFWSPRKYFYGCWFKRFFYLFILFVPLKNKNSISFLLKFSQLKSINKSNFVWLFKILTIYWVKMTVIFTSQRSRSASKNVISSFVIIWWSYVIPGYRKKPRHWTWNFCRQTCAIYLTVSVFLNVFLWKINNVSTQSTIYKSTKN